MSLTNGTMTSTGPRSSNKSRISEPKTSYNHLSAHDLERLAKTRGLGTESEIIVRALVQQDEEHAKSPFPFMFLPGELRNRIYAEVLNSPSRRSFTNMRMPALIAVSSQIWKECLSMVLDADTFELATAFHPRTPKTLPGCRCLHSLVIKRLEQIPPHHMDLLRKVGFRLRINVENAGFVTIVVSIKRDVRQTPEFGANVLLGKDWRLRFDKMTRTRYNEIRHIMLKHADRHVQQCIDDRENPFTFSARSFERIVSGIPIESSIYGTQLVDGSVN